MTRARAWARGVALLSCLAGVTGCGNNNATTTPTTVTSPTTITWSTLIGAKGTASRAFTASQAGRVSVTLQASPVALGIGVGVTPSSGGVCRPTVSQTMSPGDVPLTTPVEQGAYCVLVYDVGGIGTDQIAFTVSLEYPWPPGTREYEDFVIFVLGGPTPCAPWPRLESLSREGA